MWPLCRHLAWTINDYHGMWTTTRLDYDSVDFSQCYKRSMAMDRMEANLNDVTHNVSIGPLCNTPSTSNVSPREIQGLAPTCPTLVVHGSTHAARFSLRYTPSI